MDISQEIVELERQEKSMEYNAKKFDSEALRLEGQMRTLTTKVAHLKGELEREMRSLAQNEAKKADAKHKADALRKTAADLKQKRETKVRTAQHLNQLQARKQA